MAIHSLVRMLFCWLHSFYIVHRQVYWLFSLINSSCKLNRYAYPLESRVVLRKIQYIGILVVSIQILFHP